MAVVAIGLWVHCLRELRGVRRARLICDLENFGSVDVKGEGMEW